MCFKKKPPVIINAEKVALLFGINDYMGASNDLNGCLNDIDDVEKKLKAEFPEFVIRKFKDSEVTTSRMIDEIKAVYASPVTKFLYLHYSGHGTQIGTHEALYLYNGPLLDDVICDLQDQTPDGMKVLAKFDSCFSGGMDDRHLNPRYVKSRFYQIPGMKIERAVKKIGKRGVQKWIIFAGCGEFQTSADFIYNGRYNGAFTVFDNKSYGPNSDYQSEYSRLRTFLPNPKEDLDQAPELTGPNLTDLVLK